MKICGPKLSLCGIIISIWGIIQLVLMGFFYYIHSVALIDDLNISEEHKFKNPAEFYSAADKLYYLNAYNCWIAACLYIFTLVFSGHQFYMNNRNTMSL
ncbi:ribonuclease kappa-B [Daktulosphaira vitifoliae]|uniref:ribonuclease kappa-B n=1 Tax=Daktulosphaira vitifoliae TaxID=58002 RepID=UPI0021AAE1D8|nr:ribonuclease kappa-B [Daktulosphaira vitifoliae]